MILTKEEENIILNHRDDVKRVQERQYKQLNCTHPNKYSQGRFGHNGDEWFHCRDCGKEWSDD